jgi:TIR domain
MSLTEVEREMTKTVVARFQDQKEPTARIPLLKKFKEPDALDRLVRSGILRSNDNVQFFPTALAFHYCEEDAVRNHARKSVQIVLHVLQYLFETDEEEKEYTLAQIYAQANNMFENVAPQSISLGLYLAEEFGVFAMLRRNPEQQSEISALRIGEGIIRIKDIRNAWDDHIKQRSSYLERQRGPESRQAFLRSLHGLANGREDATISPMQFLQAGAEIGLDNDSVGQTIRYFLAENVIKQKPASQAIALTHKGVLEVEGLTRNVNALGRDNQAPAKSAILVLISHSSKDAKLAEALVDLLRSGIGLLPEHIRCSSVDGYRLPAGAHAETQLRQEVNATRVLIGLITPSSLASPYVLFELGARWGGGNPMVPVLAGVRSDELRGPLSGLNALLCSEEAQLHQLLRDLGSQLNLPVQGADSYLKHLKALKGLSLENSSSEGALQASTHKEMAFEESVYWKHKNGGREGPYCPVCYDGKHTAIHLNPGATKGTYRCGVCQNSFRTDEYDARPSRRRPFSSR